MNEEAAVKRTEVKRNRLAEYRGGAEGFFKWVEDNVRLEIYPILNNRPTDTKRWTPVREFTEDKHPITHRSYKQMWERQKEECRKALKMVDGAFVHRLLIFCWMRGEGKSLLVCLIIMWRFFCWPRLQIMLGANSKEQTKFVHYDIIRDIIRNSPNLRAIVGEKNIQEKEIRLTNSKGEVMSLIRSISTASGIVSNISVYSFSEIFDMSNPKFFHQLDGSIRNVPNAFGLIDSTVSDTSHVLYKQYESVREGKLKGVYFSHRQSVEARMEDFWNPYMTQADLDDYREKFLEAEFARYFRNSWDAGTVRPFTKEIIEETNTIAFGDQWMDHVAISGALLEKNRLEEKLISVEEKQFEGSPEWTAEGLRELRSKLMPVDSVYRLENAWGPIDFVGSDVVRALEERFKTDFSIHAGLDLSDPMAIFKRARSVLTFTAKGLINSKYDTSWLSSDNKQSLKYVYFLLGLVHVEDGSLDTIKDILSKAQAEYSGIDTFCGERYGSGDLVKWLEYNNVEYELLHPTYNRQRDCFNEMFRVMGEGRFKKPKLRVAGGKHPDLLVEEMEVFFQDTVKKWFGSPHKDEKYGQQDDSVFSLGWGIYGGRMWGPEKFRSRKPGKEMFGVFYPDSSRTLRY